MLFICQDLNTRTKNPRQIYGPQQRTIIRPVFSHRTSEHRSSIHSESQHFSIFLLRSCTRFIRPTLWLMLLDTTLLKTQARFILYSTRLDTVHVTQNGSIDSDSIVVLHDATAGFAAKQQGSRVWWRFHESPAVFPHDGYARVLAHSKTQRAK
jgi:hypothetical protein